MEQIKLENQVYDEESIKKIIINSKIRNLKKEKKRKLNYVSLKIQKINE